ncbi:MAG: DUF2892 domain-containing protein [Salinarimonadaceae bacterium]|nr:MAG: DUF2892 domain-containing protein [Salinarimonadaceae bacterium]
MSLKTITPADAKRLIDQGAVLVDVRDSAEHARERIPQARNLSLSQLDEAELPVGESQTVLFHCKSGMRTLSNADRLAAKAGEAKAGEGCEAFIVEGGIDAWRRAGLPVIEDKSAPLDLMRQVQIGAGSLAFVGTLAGAFVNPAFLIIPAFVGAGLTFAGVTGFCGMARILLLAPWNKSLRRPVAA